MRYILICLLCCILKSAKSQIHQPRQRFIEAGGGLVNGPQPRKTDHTGYWVKVSFGKYGKKEGSFQAGFVAQKGYYQPAENKISVNQYLLDGTFSPKTFASADRLIYVHPAMGVLIGYEGTSNGAAFSADSAAVNPNKYLVGFTGGINSEWNINNRMALILFIRTNYFPSSAIDRFHLHYGIGVRYNYFSH